MPLRLARTTDLPTISNIFANAFWDEDVMGQVINPLRNQYPDDFRRFWFQKVRSWYWDYTNQLVVTYFIRETSNRDGRDEEVLTGVGAWERQGDQCYQYGGLWGWWDPRNLIHSCITLLNYFSLLVFPNRAADPSKTNMGSRIFPHIKRHWTGHRESTWYLNFLGVDPAYQNQGYGRELVRWGIEQAKREDVCASVIAGTGKENFYSRCGFHATVGKVTEGEGNPLQGLTDGGAIMFRDANVSPRDKRNVNP